MNKNGFTLVELMLATAISGIIMAGILPMVKGGTVSFLHAQQQAEVISAAERALVGSAPRRGIMEDIRRCSAATAVAADRLELACPGGPRQYFRQGGSLRQAVAGSTSTIAENITALSFGYFTQQSGQVSATAAPGLVNLIEVRVTAQNAGAEFSLTASARLRNK